MKLKCKFNAIWQACWRPNAHGMKSASGKMAKQTALAFVRRTLERCQEFKKTRKSCFDEPMYRDIFLSGCSWLGDGRTVEFIGDGECGKHDVRPSGNSLLKTKLKINDIKRKGGKDGKARK